MKQLAKDILRKARLEGAARELLYRLMLAKRSLAGIDRHILSDTAAITEFENFT